MSKKSNNDAGKFADRSGQLQVMLHQALTHHQRGQWAQAQAVYESVLKIQPRHVDALRLLGYLALQTGRPQIAVQLIGKAIEINPGVVLLYVHIAEAFQAMYRFDEALASYDKALALEPNNAELHTYRGNAMAMLQRLDEALLCYNRALALQPGYVWAYNNRGNVLLQMNRLEEALRDYEKALAIKPDFASAYNNYGNALIELKRYDDALANYSKAVALLPTFADAYNNIGNTLTHFKRLDEALANYDKAIACNPNYFQAYTNKGNALKQIRRLDEALASYDKAIAINPNYVDAHTSRGATLTEIKRLDEALASFDRAIAINPQHADAYVYRAVALNDLKRPEEALASYEKAFALKPQHDFLFGNLLLAQMTVCDWRDLDTRLAQFAEQIRASRKAGPPFAVLSLLDSPELQVQAAKTFVHALYSGVNYLGAIKSMPRRERIRIGYYSADFHNHATSALMAELFEAHDKSKFELFGFSFGPNKNDEMRKRVSSAFDHFFDVSHQGDRDIARNSRQLGIDIAIDLKGFTADSRMGIFAERCAPIQVNYLGYPGTVGAKYIDYIIADATVIPKDSVLHYSESVVYLPHSYQVNDSKRKISERVFTRQEVGLPETGFVFCCFNNTYKILPSMFDSWMRILKAVDGSVLWLLEDNPVAAENLRREAEMRGIDNNRLVFAQRLPLDEHLARHKLADLFLDTLPCNAHTTASDALWAGLPVLTHPGRAFAGRVAASLLQAIDLPELIVRSSAEYEALAVELALNPLRLEQIKSRLFRNRLDRPLFNGKLFARHIELAYTAMYDRYQAGLAPDTIEIEA